MISPFKKIHRSRQIDPAIVGFWSSGSSEIDFTADGWMRIVGSSNAVVSADGTLLTDNGTSFTRLYGAGQQIEGVWQSTQIDGGITWIEDRHYRSDQTYTIQWTADGLFDSVFFGDYTHRNNVLATRERRALVTTTAPDLIELDLPFGIDTVGQYSVNALGQLSLSFGGITTVYEPG